jgi:hypothetical protein
MTDERDTTRDPELEALLRRWEAPAPPDGMDDRVMAAFRQQTRSPDTPRPFWQRWLAASIRVPVPVAVAMTLLLLFTAALALRQETPPPSAVAPRTSSPVQAARRAPAVETGSSLAGFQAVDQITATVVQEGTP